MRYYLNFLEIPMEDVANGICEIYGGDVKISEIRFCTDKTSFLTFVDKWDDKHVTSDQLDVVVNVLISKYQDKL